LQALQHRGQESAGIAVGNGQTVTVAKDLGLVTQVFNDSMLAALEGNVSIGHVRYSTSGSKATWEAAQPHMSAIDDELFVLAHNGTLTNTDLMRAHLVREGVQLFSATDSEVAAKSIGLVTAMTHHLRDGIAAAMNLMKGAYAMVLCTADSLYAFRDPLGIRPLCLGQLENGGWVVSSETCGLDIVGAKYVRDVEPGEIIRINAEGLDSRLAVPCSRRASCIFEYVYFARPDSVIDGQSVYQARRACGRILARENAVDADLVLGVPDSGVPAALGYAAESGIKYSDGIVKNRYVGRTFIQPTQEMRQMGIKLKLNPLPDVIAGKRLVVIDDSIVRGNTSKQLVQMLRDAGALEVHLRITSPEVMWPCFYGIDTDTRDQLLAANMSLDEMCEWIGCDSLAFMSIEGLREAVSGANHDGFCEACFTGDYPVEVDPSWIS
jgi:amidophosphoribosyltransferase